MHGGSGHKPNGQISGHIVLEKQVALTILIEIRWTNHLPSLAGIGWKEQAFADQTRAVQVPGFQISVKDLGLSLSTEKTRITTYG